jgi:hypothetical protein
VGGDRIDRVASTASWSRSRAADPFPCRCLTRVNCTAG